MSWTGLADRSYTGLHLGPAPKTYTDYLCTVEESKVVGLFKRGDAMVPCPKSSALFGFFVQWFTDSFLRTDSVDSRKNTSNHEIDLCQIYGLNENDTRILRSHKGGELKTELQHEKLKEQEYPPLLFERDGTTIKPEFLKLSYVNDRNSFFSQFVFKAPPPGSGRPTVPAEKKAKLFAAGLGNANSTIFYSAINAVFLREHNRLCRAMAERYPAWDDDRLFETARNTNIVQLLKIIIEDYINHLSSAHFKLFVDVGFAENQNWYRTNRIAAEFDLLYRWHSFVPKSVSLRGKPVQVEPMLLDNSLLFDLGVEEVIHAAATERAGRIMLKNTEEFLVNGADRGAVKKSRDWHIRPYNDYREHFGLPRVSSFEELTGEQAIAGELRAIYGSVDKVELLTGLFAEHHPHNSVLGELMGWMVGSDAFTHAFTNPLLSKNVYGEDCFSKVGMDSINATRCFDDIVQRNCKMGNRKATFAVAQTPPGSYGLPIIEPIRSKLDFFLLSGWEQFFRRRQIKHSSNVFKINLFQRAIAVLDHRAIEPLFESGDLVQDLPERGYKFNLPLLDLTGGVPPSMYETGPKHDRPKALYMRLLKAREATLATTFSNVASEYACRWLSLGKFNWASELEDFAADFLFQWYLGTRPDSKKVRFIYTNIFTHRLIAVTRFLPWSKYHRSLGNFRELLHFVREAPLFGEVLVLARAEGLNDADEVAKQITFVTGMNSFLGIQNLLKSIVGELSLDPELRAKLRREMEGELETEGSSGSLCQLAQLRLPLLDKTLREILRLHPPVYFIFGRATRDRTIKSDSGLFAIRRGELVMGVIPMAHLDASVFARPGQFEPHRFDHKEGSDHLIWPRGMHDGEATPENRTCPGKNIAVQIAKLFCFFLLTKYEWRLKNPPEWEKQRFRLNVAAPKGTLEVLSFRHRVQQEHCEPASSG
ncbi:MAG: cytochrome P450 [Beijerinckiaceae bacterium]|nr:cytochrome P450 [Beijerinckiaceae bacterium]